LGTRARCQGWANERASFEVPRTVLQPERQSQGKNAIIKWGANRVGGRAHTADLYYTVYILYINSKSV
jgi:hypothetical protein